MVKQTVATEEGVKTEGTVTSEKKKGFLSKFMTFLYCGGFLLILMLIAAIFIVISSLTYKPG